MKKNYKKSVAALSALSLAASSAVMPIMASAASSITINGDKAAVTAETAGVAIVASYDKDGRLTSVASKTVAEGATEEVSVQPGDKVMLWDSLNGDKPLTDAVAVTEEDPTAPPTDPTAPPTDPTAPPTDPTAPPTDPTAPPTDPTTPPENKVWKFDFGSAEDVAEGYTYVAPDRNYTAAGDYGFLGTDENDYHLGNRYDGFGTQEGQVITLSEGGGTGLNDGIGSTGADIYGNAGDKYYPTRFALKVEDEQYFKVKATVTTLDSTKPATASLYTERKHPLYTDKTIAAGEAVTTEFTIRTTPIYYEKSDPKGAIKDEMVNVAVLGENTALAALEIEQLDTATTVWVLGDSTVTDGNCNLPFFRLQNYTGVGTGLTKYLPADVAMVNEGEGGLSAADNNHFNMVKNRIKAGDYMYVEYGHNHKSDGPTGYKACLDKYYDACHAVGAKLIIVSPVQSINSWNSETKQYNDRFGGETNFAGVGKAYVSEKQAAGADDIAFVDLTKTSVEWVNKITADNGDSADAIKYYYQTGKGGGTDQSHPNDLGAENFAYCFFNAAKEVTDESQKAVLERLLTGMRDETPNLVSEDIVAGGVGGDAWPIYIVPTNEEYPVQIKNIKFNDDGTVASAKVKVVNAKVPLAAYGIIVITIKDAAGSEVGKVYAIDQVDNSTGLGYQEIVNFTKDVTLPEGGTYSAMVWKALDVTGGGIQIDPEMVQYSWEYVPADISEYLLSGQDSEVETFDYYGKEQLSDVETWKHGGSAAATLTLGKDGEITYSKIASDGAKNGAAGQGSFYIMRALENLENGTGTHGRYMISVDAKYNSGGGLNFALAKTTTPNKSPFVSDQFTAFTIGDSGKVTVKGQEVGAISALEFTNIQYIIDMDAGVAEVSVGGAAAQTIDLPEYQIFTAPAIDTHKNFILEGQKVAFDIDITNLTVAKLKDGDAKTTVSTAVAAGLEEYGSVYVNEEGTTTATVAQSSDVVVKAVPNDGYVFTGWTADGVEFSKDAELSIRLYKDLALTANFDKQHGVEAVTSFELSSNKAVLKAGDGAEATVSVSNVIDASGNPVAYETSDITWSCDEPGVTVADGTVTIGADFSIDANAVKNVVIKATINGVEKTYTIAVFSYAYYEEISKDSNYDGVNMTIGGKDAVVFGGANENHVYSMGNPITLDKATKITMDMAWSGTNTCGQLRTLNFRDSAGNTIFSMAYSWTGLQVNGTDIANAVAKDTWTPMVIEINPETNEVTVTVGETSATTTLAGTELADIQFASAGSVPAPDARALGMSKIVVEQ